MNLTLAELDQFQSGLNQMVLESDKHPETTWYDIKKLEAVFSLARHGLATTPRPIKEAPKDGSWHLLSGGKVGKGWEDKKKPKGVVAFWDKHPFDSGWYFDHWDGSFRSGYYRPKFFIPITALVKP